MNGYTQQLCTDMLTFMHCGHVASFVNRLLCLGSCIKMHDKIDTLQVFHTLEVLFRKLPVQRWLEFLGKLKGIW